MRPKVFVSRIIPDEGLDLVREACDAEIWQDELPPPRDALLRAIEGCEGVLTLLTDRVDDEFLDRAGPQLKVVSNFAVGFDNIDVPACTARRIPVGNTPGVLTETTADLAWALLMAAARRLVEGDRYVRAGNWKTWGPMLLMGPDVHGATIGIIGFGRIGQAVARRARGFGMRILYHDPRQDGLHGRREPARGRARRAPADAGQPRGVRLGRSQAFVRRRPDDPAVQSTQPITAAGSMRRARPATSASWVRRLAPIPRSFAELQKRDVWFVVGVLGAVLALMWL